MAIPKVKSQFSGTRDRDVINLFIESLLVDFLQPEGSADLLQDDPVRYFPACTVTALFLSGSTRPRLHDIWHQRPFGTVLALAVHVA